MIDDVVYVASLRGERPWLFDTADSDDEPWAVCTDVFGRLRDVSPGPSDDRLLQLTLPER